MKIPSFLLVPIPLLGPPSSRPILSSDNTFLRLSGTQIHHPRGTCFTTRAAKKPVETKSMEPNEFGGIALSGTDDRLPMVGLGTFQCKGGECYAAVLHALKVSTTSVQYKTVSPSA